MSQKLVINLSLHLSHICGLRCANKWGTTKVFLYNFLKSWKITQIMLDVLKTDHTNYIEVIMNPKLMDRLHYCLKNLPQHLSHICGKPCANKWGVAKDILYNFSKSWKITQTTLVVPKIYHNNYIEVVMIPKIMY